MQAAAAVEHWELMLLKAKQAGDKKAETEVRTIPSGTIPAGMVSHAAWQAETKLAAAKEKLEELQVGQRTELHAAMPRTIQSACAHTCPHAHVSACAHRQDTRLCHNCS